MHNDTTQDILLIYNHRGGIYQGSKIQNNINN